MSVPHAIILRIRLNKDLIANERWSEMTAIYPLASVCGSNTFYVDPYEVNLNPNGAICCDNCRSILICREAWDHLYKEAK